MELWKFSSHLHVKQWKVLPYGHRDIFIRVLPGDLSEFAAECLKGFSPAGRPGVGAGPWGTRAGLGRRAAAFVPPGEANPPLRPRAEPCHGAPWRRVSSLTSAEVEKAGERWGRRRRSSVGSGRALSEVDTRVLVSQSCFPNSAFQFSDSFSYLK